VPDLVAALDDPQSGEDAAWAMSRIGPAARPAVPKLIAKLKNRKGGGFDIDSYGAAAALGQIGDKQAIPVLEEAARSRDDNLSRISQNALRNLREDSKSD
jgi:HEAT repeat protein